MLYAYLPGTSFSALDWRFGCAIRVGSRYKCRLAANVIACADGRSRRITQLRYVLLHAMLQLNPCTVLHQYYAWHFSTIALCAFFPNQHYNTKRGTDCATAKQKLATCYNSKRRSEGLVMTVTDGEIGRKCLHGKTEDGLMLWCDEMQVAHPSRLRYVPCYSP